MMPGKVTVLKHPVVNSRLADLRQIGTSPKEFRQVSVALFSLRGVRFTPTTTFALW
jgi:uracil phosphoribosyltransferase